MSNLFVVFFSVVFPWLAFTTHAREAVEFIKFIILWADGDPSQLGLRKQIFLAERGKSDFT